MQRAIGSDIMMALEMHPVDRAVCAGRGGDGADAPLGAALARGARRFAAGAQGFFSIRQISSGEVMHSMNRPSDEACAVYIELSRLAARVRQAERREGRDRR